jgi:predicted HicB family RNase H-like nuclease
MTSGQQHAEVRRTAEALRAKDTDWVTFYREVFGLRGIIRRFFPTREDLAGFEQTEVYQEVVQMLTQLRSHGPSATDSGEPTRVITVRLPKSMHDALRVEAHEHHTSMNKLCISKLLQFIDNGQVPTEFDA